MEHNYTKYELYISLVQIQIWAMKNTKNYYKNSSNAKNLLGKPFVIYSNLVSNVKIIFKDNKGKSDIYRWNNLITGASYVGSAVDLSKRFRNYFYVKFIKKELLKNNSVIYKALLKYGYSNFNLEILEYCDNMSILNREQNYIDILKPKYNLCPIAGSSLGRITREETKLKLRNFWLNKQFIKSKYSTLKEFIINSIEKKLNESEFKIIKLHKKLIRIKQLKESKVSFVTRMKILASTKTKQTILVTDVIKGITSEYPSARRAAEALNASNSTIMNKLKSKNNRLYKDKYLIRRKLIFN